MKETLSVITICFNNLAELIKTCYSVDQQTILPDEHLIIDGSSNTEILNWLQSTQQPTYRRWVHERDNGIADAFNKGVQNSKFSITHILNSGDTYCGTNTIGVVMDFFKNDPSLMWVHGQYIQYRGDIDVISGTAFDKDQLWKGMRAVAHPTMFIKKEVYDRVGLYNTDVKIAMDYDLLVRMRNEKSFYIQQPLSYFAPGGASSTQISKGLNEVKNSYQKYIGYSFKQTLWQLRQKALHYFMQTAVGKKWFQWKNRNNKSAI
jgi:glycosyltransferase involved in cell wall biosynthesis